MTTHAHTPSPERVLYLWSIIATLSLLPPRLQREFSIYTRKDIFLLYTTPSGALPNASLVVAES